MKGRIVMRFFESCLIVLFVLVICILIFRLADGIAGKAFLNAYRPTAAYSVDARSFDGG